MWFECASSNDDVAPTTEELDTFLDKASEDSKLVDEVYHRFALTRGSKKFISWMKKSFFWQNATTNQLDRMFKLVPWKF